MNEYLKLGIAALLPVLAALLLYLLDKKTAFGKLKFYQKQIIFGVIFGALAILGTEWGININGAVVNCRDGAVLTAGLLFGGPAGIIAGLMGGIERWFAVYWGAGSFTRVACTVSTALAGFYAALLRKYMFDNKKPGWGLSLSIGLVVEVFHLTMVFVTNISDPTRALEVVRSCSAPMLIANSVSVCLATILLTLAAKEKLLTPLRPERTNISQTIQRWLLVCVAIAFVISTLFTYALQINEARDQTDTLLENSLVDIQNSIQYASKENCLKTAYMVKNDTSGDSLEALSQKYGVEDIILVDKNGIVSDSTNPDYIGFDMNSGEQSRAFMCLLNGQDEFVQEFGPLAIDSSIQRKFVGVSTEDGFIQVGYNEDQVQESVSSEIIASASNRTVGQDGYVVVIDRNNQIVLPAEYAGQKADGFDPNALKSTMERHEISIRGVNHYYMSDSTEGFYIISLITEEEVMEHARIAMFAFAYVEILIFAVFFVMIFLLINNVIVRKMHRINESLSEITEGNMDTIVNVRSNSEFATLSDDINTTVDTLKHYIDLAAARFDKELELAKNIQSSALPTIFPDREDFDIYACMDTAKEVGGDFYDFYLNHKKKLNMVIADVSGKGIPAAMFMMRSKTELKSLSETDIPINDVFTHANNNLCEGNDAGMFVTAWQGQVNLETGLVNFANAGHNPPVVRHKDGQFAFLKSRAGLVLAGMEGMMYRKQELQLEPGDIVYLYTDGITEATNANNELYGDDRLLNILNTMEFTTMKDICENVKADVAKFVGDAPQFDDMTMLAFRYNGLKAKPQIHFDEAKIENIPAVTEFVESELEKMDCPFKAITQISIVIDEVYSNIAKFAYENGQGPVTVIISKNEETNRAVLTFVDEGRPYNPLTKEDPDVTLSAEERDIGGLGIFMVKKIMDEVKYEYSNEQNILTLEKNL